eukprot:CAMPEP_0198578810 /NCGR_PEP_ID=MMETSP1462-20131121/120709_1 /TAXON_ID=1333877 /ORGANISM="Brandtodinium nutriculum, Strain RCC3387" /LENGTH=112 /DNA_ID=CAMNT_0044310117 /DNA_START=3 /DNA_END=337 /DNA_ORIENTATION=-
MKFRLGEGDGTAFYLLGVRDSGVALGLTPGEHAAAVRILMGVASLMGNVLLLEAFSDRRHGGKRCSAWRVQSRGLALKEVKDILHMGSWAEPGSDRHARSDAVRDKAPPGTS